ncbi:RraA family protein [Saccharopolyspora sp. K220]|uniref:RraA family protein n=1 Tax=Saccharopolyspora soli TaxID=2926618 RepID=UPI001F59F4AE|nr:RraA family protein [Saccharopolyspora soli]MCI2417915.1 RraA family protein [Saccharopolyspora soli]
MMNAQNTDLTTMATELGCASIVDAMGRTHRHRAHLLSLISPTPQRPMFGPAVTIAFLPYRDDFTDSNAAGFAGWFYRAVGAAPAGLVLVLSSGGYPDASHGGGTKMSRLHNHGLAGLLCDGRLRDFDELARYRFATWCTGEATRAGGDTVTPCAANISVEVRGVCITPGDYIYADRAGAVVIPAQSVREVLAEAHRVESEDAAFLPQIRDEDPAALREGRRTSRER